MIDVTDVDKLKQSLKSNTKVIACDLFFKTCFQFLDVCSPLIKKVRPLVFKNTVRLTIIVGLDRSTSMTFHYLLFLSRFRYGFLPRVFSPKCKF